MYGLPVAAATTQKVGDFLPQARSASDNPGEKRRPTIEGQGRILQILHKPSRRFDKRYTRSNVSVAQKCVEEHAIHRAVSLGDGTSAGGFL
jgi:hypothetical protein